MFRIAKDVKSDSVRRWALPDRVFFACGACHILAYAFLEAHEVAGFKPVWIKPASGFGGNHIVVVRGEVAFDYHGYSNWSQLLAHTMAKAKRWWPEWASELIVLPMEVLISETKSRAYDGLWLREPQQYLHDALPRARRFVRRFPAPGRSPGED